jgi:hypothetical protein
MWIEVDTRVAKALKAEGPKITTLKIHEHK